MRLLMVVLVGLVLGCGDRETPVSVEPAGKVSGGGLFDLFKTGGSAIVGVDSTAAETPADSTAAAVADTTEAAPLSPAEARAELARLGIVYTERAFLDSAGSGNVAVVRLFVEAGMSVETTYASGGLTVLSWAAGFGHLEVVKYLVGQGADVNATRDNGRPVLHSAAISGDLAVVQYLVEQGADVTATDNDGYTVLDVAEGRDHTDIVAYLEEVLSDTTETEATVTDTTDQVVSLSSAEARAELDRRGISYRTWAFLDSAAAGNWEVVRLFVQAGMSVDTADRHGLTVLHRAASRGDLEVVKFLVGLGASIGATDEDDLYFTALHYAAEGGHLEVVQYLVGQGADVMAETDFGQTALHEAAYEGHLEVVEYLVGAGADVEDTDEDSWTPSQWAAWAGHWDVVKYLESLVVEVSRTPDEARAELEARGIDYTAGSFNHAAFKGNLVVVKLFVQAGMSVETTTNTSGTVLQSAAAGGHWAVVKYLVGQGADVNAKDNVNGWPALHYAANNGHLAVVKYLVEQGADVNATSNSGRTARDLVAVESDIAAYLESVGG